MKLQQPATSASDCKCLFLLQGIYEWPSSLSAPRIYSSQGPSCRHRVPWSVDGKVGRIAQLKLLSPRCPDIFFLCTHSVVPCTTSGCFFIKWLLPAQGQPRWLVVLFFGHLILNVGCPKPSSGRRILIAFRIFDLVLEIVGFGSQFLIH